MTTDPARNCRPDLICRVLVDAASVPRELLEDTRDDVWLSRTTQCARYTLRGVPGRLVDVLIDRRITRESGAPDHLVTVEVVRKPGRYDGAVRDRLTWRAWRPCDLPADVRPGTIDFDADLGTDLIAEVRDNAGQVVWSAGWSRLRSSLDGYDLPRIVMWHWTRYYQVCIPHEEARALADSMVWAPAPLPPAWTLAEANRAASRALYRLARDGGWRKLTAREQTRLGLTGQWHCEETYAAALYRRIEADGCDPTGTGEATLRAAGGGTLESLETT